MATLLLLLAASLPGLVLPEEEGLLIVYPTRSILQVATNEIEDGWTPIKDDRPHKPVYKTRSTSSVSSSSSTFSTSSREDRVETQQSRLGRLDSERMRAFYSRRKPHAPRYPVLTQTRLPITLVNVKINQARKNNDNNDRREKSNLRQGYNNLRVVNNLKRNDNSDQTVKRERSKKKLPVSSISWGATSTEEKRSRLRRILAPKPRHSRGPMPTLVTPQVEEVQVVVEEFHCPLELNGSKRLWKAYADPSSCRHYYICVSRGNGSVAAPVRHGCTQDLEFSPDTETCTAGGECGRVSKRRSSGPAPTTTTTTAPRSSRRQGLFMEFIEFLIRSRLFNHKVMKSLLDNKELFQ